MRIDGIFGGGGVGPGVSATVLMPVVPAGGVGCRRERRAGNALPMRLRCGAQVELEDVKWFAQKPSNMVTWLVQMAQQGCDVGDDEVEAINRMIDVLQDDVASQDDDWMVRALAR